MFKLLKWSKNIHQSTWDPELLYVDRFSKDESSCEISGSHGGEYEV
jgi:hypothetical protein